MIIEFSVSNFRSFKDKQTLSLVAGQDANHPNALIPVDQDHLLKAAALYGANASGKSNLIKAMKVMREFVLCSATTMNIGDKIKGIAPFRLDKQTREKPSQFEIDVIIGSTRYTYGFSATADRVFSEWLREKPALGKGRTCVIFTRTWEPNQGKTSWFFPAKAKIAAEADIIRERTRDNGLALSRGAELNVSQLSDVFVWLRNGFRVFEMSEDPRTLVQETKRAAKQDSLLLKKVAKLLSQADTGIADVAVSESEFDNVETPDGTHIKIPPKLMDSLRESGAFLSVQTRHLMPGDQDSVDFNLEGDESNGTQRLFALAGPFFDGLEKGSAIVVDELECSLHPLLTRKLIAMFQSSEHNKKGAQLLFATHDVTLMDPQLLRRDQIWLVEKNAEGASELYSLYDFKEGEEGSRPRSTEAFLRNYLAGRYGAVPSFGPALEDIDTQ